jgi:hypothetical protein
MEILDLFVECLMAARGERGRGDGATLQVDEVVSLVMV